MIHILALNSCFKEYWPICTYATHKKWFEQSSVKKWSYLSFTIFAKECLKFWTKIRYIFSLNITFAFARWEGIWYHENDFPICNFYCSLFQFSGAVCSNDLSWYNVQGASMEMAWSETV